MDNIRREVEASLIEEHGYVSHKLKELQEHLLGFPAATTPRVYKPYVKTVRAQIGYMYGYKQALELRAKRLEVEL